MAVRSGIIQQRAGVDKRTVNRITLYKVARTYKVTHIAFGRRTVGDHVRLDIIAVHTLRSYRLVAYGGIKLVTRSGYHISCIFRFANKADTLVSTVLGAGRSNINRIKACVSHIRYDRRRICISHSAAYARSSCVTFTFATRKNSLIAGASERMSECRHCQLGINKVCSAVYAVTCCVSVFGTGGSSNHCIGRERMSLCGSVLLGVFHSAELTCSDHISVFKTCRSNHFALVPDMLRRSCNVGDLLTSAGTGGDSVSAL